MDELQRMLELIKDPDPQIRKYALSQLEVFDAIEDEEVLEQLRIATGDSDPAVSHEANRVLVALLHRSFGTAAKSESPIPHHVVPEGDFEGMSLGTLRMAGLSRLEEVLERLHAVAIGADLALAKRAIISLAKVGAPISLPILTETLGKPSLGEVSAVALSQLTTEEALTPLLEVVASDKGPVRSHAVLALGAFDNAKAVDKLCELVKDTNPVVRANVAMALGEVRDNADAIGALGRLARDQEVWVALAALQALTHNEDERAFDYICAACSEASDPRVRASCVSALGLRGDIRATQVLIEYLSAPDDRVRANAVEALGALALPGDDLKRHLAPLATDENNRVVANVAVALHGCEPGKTIQVVRSLLASDDLWAKASGIWCLGEMRTPETMLMLTQVLADNDEENRARAIRALDKWSGVEPTPALLDLLGHNHVPTRARVARALGKFSGDGLATALANRLAAEKEPTVRSALIFAINSQPAASLEPIRRALQDKDPRVVADAVEALGETSDMQVINELRPLISHQNNRVRANACVALWSSGELEVADDLLVMLAPTSPGSQRSGMYAAGEMGRILRLIDSSDTDPALLSALKRFCEQVSRGEELPEAPTAVPRDVTAGANELEAILDTYIKEGVPAALSLLDKIAAGHPLPTEIAFLSYRLRAEAGKAAEAFRILESIGEMTGNFVTPVLELAHGYSRLRLEDKAVVCFLEAYRRHQAILGEILEVAARSVQSSRLSDATQLCKFLMGNPTVSPEIHVVAGRELLAAGDFASAFPHLLRAHLCNPRTTAIALDYAYAACRLGRMELGRRLCESIFHLSKGDESAAPVVAKAQKMYEAIKARLDN